MNCKDYHGYTVWDDGTVICKKLLKQSITTGGYSQVNLYINGKKKHMLVHRLVALAFLPNFYGKPTVDHKDRKDKTNNSLYNLKWATYEEQARNKGIPSTNTSGVKGVSYCNRDRLWRARLVINGRRLQKSFKIKEDAIAQRLEWEKIYYHI